MDTRNFEKVNYKTKYNWSNTIRGQIKVSSKEHNRLSNWNMLPLANKFEYSKKLFNI